MPVVPKELASEKTAPALKKCWLQTLGRRPLLTLPCWGRFPLTELVAVVVAAAAGPGPLVTLEAKADELPGPVPGPLVGPVLSIPNLPMLPMGLLMWLLAVEILPGPLMGPLVRFPLVPMVLGGLLIPSRLVP